MIIIFQNNKLVGIDKELLNTLNLSLQNLNDILSPLELSVASLKNENINLNSKNFKIMEIPILSVEDIKIFKLTPQISKSESEAVNETSSLISLEDELFKEENLLNIQPEKKELPEHKEVSPEIIPNEKQFVESEITAFEPVVNLNNEISAAAENKPFENDFIVSEPELTNEDLMQKENEEITISFNDEFEEINNILSLDKSKAKELLDEDLKKASKDLGIDITTLRNLFDTLLEQIEENKENFKNALIEKNYDKLHKTAHLLKGAALNLRLSNIALILKTIDEESKKSAPIEKIEYLINQFYTFIDKIKENEKNTVNETKIPEHIKNLIIETIKNYLTTQNEKKFKKDLRYIEKLLNTKINSVEELQNLLKDNK